MSHAIRKPWFRFRSIKATAEKFLSARYKIIRNPFEKQETKTQQWGFNLP
jgi:hypothetical protein